MELTYVGFFAAPLISDFPFVFSKQYKLKFRFASPRAGRTRVPLLLPYINAIH